MKKKLFEAIGTCDFCKEEIQDIEIIGKKGICQSCLEALAKLLHRWKTW